MNIKSLIKLILIVLVVLKSTVSQGVDIDLDFENGAVGSKATSVTCVPNGDPMTIWASNKSYFSADESYGPGQSMELNVLGGTEAYGDFGGIITLNSCGGRNLVKGDEAWVRLRTKFPVGFDYTAWPKLKFLRFRTFEDASCIGSCNGGFIDWYINPVGSLQGGYTETGAWWDKYYAYGFIKEATDAPLQDWKYFGDESDAISLGQWITYEYYVKLDSKSVDNGGQALIRIWKDGILLTEITDRRTLGTDAAVVTDFLFFTYWNGLAPKTQKMYIDDLRIVATPDVPSDLDADSNQMIGMGNSTSPEPPIIE